MSTEGAQRMLLRARRVLLAAVAVTTLVLVGASAPASAAIPAHYSAPYLEASSSSIGDMAADLSATGTKYYTLAFLIPSSGCNAPTWEANGGGPSTFNTQINSLRSSGGDVIISFGGAAGGELAQTCTNVSSLQAAYANVVSSTGVTRLDFDIEGSVLDDTASNARRDQALAALQAANPSVQVDFTLPVAPSGMLSNATALLNDAKAKGVRVSVVNIMTMDFGAGTNDLQAAESGATGAANQIASIFGISNQAAWNMLGLTPIAGTNDDGTFFSQSDAQSLESFAASHGVQELAFWEVDHYDKATGYAYSRAFNAITGSSGGGGTVSDGIAQGKPTTASSSESATYPASAATDGNSSTRWSSLFSDPQWIQVDLGSSYNVTQVTLSWEAAYGRSFQIQTSPDGSAWTTIFSTTTGAGGIQTLNVTGTGRYVRMYGTARGTAYGYSLWDFGIQGTPASGGGGGISSSAWYTVVNQNSNACVDDAGTANGSIVQQWACSNATNQQWQFQPTDSGYYKVVNRRTTTQAWDVTGGASATGDSVKIQTWAYGGGTNQQWQPVSLGSGYYKMVARNSGKCLDVPAASTANGVQLQQYTCNGTTAQAFRLAQQP
jgi:chitinase